MCRYGGMLKGRRYSASDFEMALSFGNFLLAIKLFLTRDMSFYDYIWGLDYAYAVSRLKFPADGWQHIVYACASDCRISCAWGYDVVVLDAFWSGASCILNFLEKVDEFCPVGWWNNKY